MFYVESDSWASGRRIALAEYPKRDDPFAEDMGKRATRHQIQGYLIGPNYMGPRDALKSACEQQGPGKLIHPLLGEMQVACETYTVTESRERGGYCVFDMNFVEAGEPGDSVPGTDTQGNVQSASGGAEAASVSAFNSQMQSGSGGFGGGGITFQ